jgi:UDP-N-acetylglucosamine 1-carboxyvinyltransferase
MATFEITGGFPLKGELTPQGAKNEALQVICATLLTKQMVTIRNIPNIADVQNLIKLLGKIGVETIKVGDSAWSFRAESIDIDFFESDEFRIMATRLRGSVMLLGPLIARFGIASMPQPGGDKIGRRRLDTHFHGLTRLGAQVDYDPAKEQFVITGHNMKGAYILLEEASVTGTANVLMAAVLTPGTTTIFNAACEPYVQQLCLMLTQMGAKINGIGSNLLSVEGVDQLDGTEHMILPDMIEIGSFIGLAALTQSEITIKQCFPEHLGMIPKSFSKLGIQIEQRGTDLFIPAQDHYEIETFMDGSIMTISDAPWPGLTPDLLSVFLVVATQARGSLLIHQKMFESRLFFVDKLIDMGARIILCDPHRATVIGLDRLIPLHSATLISPDIRAGVALLIAALSAEGKSIIHNIEQIDRGYELIDQRLNAIGAQIKRL